MLRTATVHIGMWVIYLLLVGKVGSSHKARNLAQSLVDFEEHHGRLDARQNLIAVNVEQAGVLSSSEFRTVTAVKMWSPCFHRPLEYRI